MNFSPRTEDQIASDMLLEYGDYDYTVLEATDRISKSGNEMIELQLRVYANDNSERIVYDYLLEKMAFKLRHFCESTGLLSKYDRGMLTAQDCIGVSGIARIARQEAKGGYPPKNTVEDYIVKQRDILRPPSTMPPAIDSITGEKIATVEGTPF